MLIRLSRTKCHRDTAEITPVSPDVPTAGASTCPGANTAAVDNEPPAPPILSLREAADWLCVSLPTLKRTIAKGDLNTIRVGKRRKVPASYLAAYVAKDILLPEQVIGLD
jgi:excisionase family DNA binding protein